MCIQSDRTRAGFGLVELLVAVSVLILIMGIVLTRHSSFNSAVVLKNEAYNIALFIKDAQQRAVAAQRQGGDGFRNRVGVQISAHTPRQIEMFADPDPGSANRFEPGSDAWLGDLFLDQQFVITDLQNQSGTSLWTGGIATTTVMFQRPNYDAYVYTVAADGTVTEMTSLSELRIIIRPTAANQAADTVESVRRVIVSATGQVTVE